MSDDAQEKYESHSYFVERKEEVNDLSFTFGILDDCRILYGRSC